MTSADSPNKPLSFTYDVRDDNGDYYFTVVNDSIKGTGKIEDFMDCVIMEITRETGMPRKVNFTMIMVKYSDEIIAVIDNRSDYTVAIKNYNLKEDFRNITKEPVFITVKRYYANYNLIPPESEDLTQYVDDINALYLSNKNITIQSSTGKNYSTNKQLFFEKFPVIADSTEFDPKNNHFFTKFDDTIIQQLINASTSGQTIGQIEIKKENISSFVNLLQSLDYLGYEYNQLDLAEIEAFMDLMNFNEIFSASMKIKIIAKICVRNSMKYRMNRLI